MDTPMTHPLREWEKWDSKRKGHFVLALFENCFVTLRVYGKGTVEGTKNLVSAFDELFDSVEVGGRVRVLVDMANMQGAPLRAQAVLGKWLVKKRNRIERAGVFGGRTMETKVARTIVRLAKLEGIVAFHESEDAALGFLTGNS